MKNIFIAGVARSGKSTFSKILNQNHLYNHIPLDYFTSSFKHHFPETNITSNVVIDPKSSKKLALFLSRVIQIIDSSDELFILDSAHLYPNDILPYLDREKWDVYFLGYPNINPIEKFNIIRKYDTEHDWTFRKSDEELLDILKKLIKISIEIQNQCQMSHISFIDTSYNFQRLFEFKREV